MEIRSLFHPDGPWMEVVVSGLVGGSEILNAYDRFLTHPQFRPGMHLLCDLRQAELKTKLESLQQLVECVADSRERRGRNYRVAILVRYAFQESISRLYALLSRRQPFECRVFRDRATAVQWLLGNPSIPA